MSEGEESDSSIVYEFVKESISPFRKRALSPQMSNSSNFYGQRNQSRSSNRSSIHGPDESTSRKKARLPNNGERESRLTSFLFASQQSSARNHPVSPGRRLTPGNPRNRTVSPQLTPRNRPVSPQLTPRNRTRPVSPDRNRPVTPQLNRPVSPFGTPPLSAGGIPPISPRETSGSQHVCYFILHENNIMYLY